MPKVSIICATYNHQDYIADCIESILHQTESDWELIIIDDGSTDKTAEIISTYDDPRIYYCRRVHCGITGLYSLYAEALKYCTGEFIAIQEGDDCCPKDKLSHLLAAMDGPDVVLSYGVTQLIDEHGAYLNQTIPTSLHLEQYQDYFSNTPVGIAAKEMLKNNALWMGTVTSLIRRSALDAIGGFQKPPIGCILDRPTFFELALIGEFRFIQQVTGYWRQHSSSTKNKVMWSMMVNGLRQFIDQFIDRSQEVLQLSRKEITEIKKYWKNNVDSSRLACGRALLIQGDYQTARKNLLLCMLSSKKVRYIFPSMVGYISSFWARDIEWIYGRLGRSSFK